MKSILIVLLSLIPLLALADNTPEPQVIRENASLFSWYLGIAIAVIGVMLGRYIYNSDQNNQKQWDKIDSHETRLTTVETEHKVMKERHCHYHKRSTDNHEEGDE